jgi:exosortase/archaeosortase family protein
VNGHLLAKTTLMLVVAVLVFVATQDIARDLEVSAVVSLLDVVLPGTLIGAGTDIVVTPTDGLPFLASVRPSCSAAGAVVALSVLGSLIARSGRIKATFAAIVVVVLGNLLRIGASVGVGVVYGKSSLVLFHDAAGGAFTFLYLLMGFATYLWFTLPKTTA